MIKVIKKDVLARFLYFRFIKNYDCKQSEIKNSFRPSGVLTVHWDGKKMKDLNSNDKIERLAV